MLKINKTGRKQKEHLEFLKAENRDKTRMVNKGLALKD